MLWLWSFRDLSTDFFFLTGHHIRYLCRWCQADLSDKVQKCLAELFWNNRRNISSDNHLLHQGLQISEHTRNPKTRSCRSRTDATTNVFLMKWPMCAIAHSHLNFSLNTSICLVVSGVFGSRRHVLCYYIILSTLSLIWSQSSANHSLSTTSPTHLMLDGTVLPQFCGYLTHGLSLWIMFWFLRSSVSGRPARYMAKLSEYKQGSLTFTHQSDTVASRVSPGLVVWVSFTTSFD